MCVNIKTAGKVVVHTPHTRRRRSQSGAKHAKEGVGGVHAQRRRVEHGKLDF
jgi:hypothetical protein